MYKRNHLEIRIAKLFRPLMCNGHHVFRPSRVKHDFFWENLENHFFNRLGISPQPQNLFNTILRKTSPGDFFSSIGIHSFAF